MEQVLNWPEILPRPVYRTLTKLKSLDPWFEIYEVSGGIYAICEPFHFEEAISFLILGFESRRLRQVTGIPGGYG